MVTSVLRSVFIWLDSLIYSLIGTAYELLMDIARIDILEDTTVEAFADRVYALLAVFMLFRLSFSILTYIINPDNSTDKSAGAGKLIGNVLITLVMLISAPWLFAQVRSLQSDLLEDNIVGKIILGTTTENNMNDDGTLKDNYISNQLDPGRIMSWTTFEAFFQPVNEDALENYTIESEGDEELSAATVWERVQKSQSVNAVNKFGLTNLTDENGDYAFDYLPLISTIAGGFIAYILLLFCFQIAVRSVKLSALQLIAPIPIISYIDPKQGKDGMFKKWYKLCIKTFADLFIRLAAIYFAVFIIGELIANLDAGEFANSNVFVKVIIIIGALMFAKELPKFIEEITGIKLSGGFSLSPTKALGSIPLIGGSLAAGAALGAGVAKTGLWTAGQTSKGLAQKGAGALLGRTRWSEQGQSLKNAGSSTFRGIKEGGLSRMQATGSEASGRFKASGWSGTDKYSGDTRSAIVGKEKQELRNTAKKGKVEIAQKNRQWDYGQMLAKQSKGDVASVFNSEEYRKSYRNVDDLKAKMYDAKAEMTRIENAGVAGFNSEEEYTAAIKEAQANFGSIEKKYNAAKSTHESLGKVHRSDAEKEAAISFFKDSGGNVNDGTGGARPSPKEQK